MKIQLILITALFCVFGTGSAKGETVVTTYVTKVQEERKSTRFTLTEWLRIKERMKWMDLWLAMFSKKEEPFRPEFNLSYYQTAGLLDTNDNLSKQVTTSGLHGQATLWLTNLVSSTTGVRMVNIDLGLNGGQRLNNFDIGSSALAQPATHLTYWGGNLRLFGKHIQDSSLSLRGGKAQGNNLSATDTTEVKSPNFMGDYYGGNLQLYFWSWLGIEGNYDTMSAEYLNDDVKNNLSRVDINYSAFIEISLLRLIIGNYSTEVQTKAFDTVSTQKEQGTFAGIRLHL